MKRLVLLLGLVALVAGCARTSSMTTLRSDGTFTRSIKFTVNKGMDDSASIDKVFKLPSGGQWKVKKTDDKDKFESTLTMDAKVGDAPVNDIQIKNKKGLILVNSFGASSPTAGQFEYKETFTWKGPADDQPDKALGQMKDSLKKALPADTSAATITAIATDLRNDLWKVMFGPGDPMLLTLLANPDHASKKLGAAIGKSLDTALGKHMASWGDADSRRAFVRKFVTELNFDDVMKKPDPSEPPSEDGGDSGLVPMYVCVRVPGKIIETNGEYDPITGDVFWSLYPEAAQLGPVTLRVVCESK